jgi:hypothetical protein
MMMKPKLADGTIVYRLLSPVAGSLSNAFKDNFDTSGMEYVQPDSSQGEEWMESIKRLDTKSIELGCRISKHASRHFIIKRHLAIDLRKMDTRQAVTKAHINGKTLHLFHEIATPFEDNYRDSKNTLVHGKDFLSSYKERIRV